MIKDNSAGELSPLSLRNSTLNNLNIDDFFKTFVFLYSFMWGKIICEVMTHFTKLY